MGNRKTPLIKALRHLGDNYSSGGTMYVFPSATEDIGLNLNSNVNGVALSHYALLNIPALPNSAYTSSGRVDNTPEGASKAIAMSLQNYMMNLETLLLNDLNYNLADLNTVSEKVFWHWAKHVGILKASNYEKVFNDNSGYNNIYYDKGFNADHNIYQQDDTVIKCFGSIDAGNSLSSDFGMFNETYINIPTSYGAGPVFLRSSYDNNFRKKTYTATSENMLEGRDDTTYNSYLGDDAPLFDNIMHQYKLGEDFDGLEIVKDIDTLQRVMRRRFSTLPTNNEKDTDANINISSYDDINVDINNLFNIDTEFEFNAILLYYSIYNQDDNIKTPQATNLFGIIFLDSPRQSNDDGIERTFAIPTFKKVKSTSERFGNSYSFRVNIKTLSVYDNTDAVIQDNTTMSSISSMDFSDVIYQLNRAIDIMNTNVNATQKVSQQYNSIISFYDTQSQKIDDISTALFSYLNGSHTSFLDTSALFVNTIKVNSKNTSNNLEFYVIDVSDNTENLYYGSPVMTIDSSGTHSDNIFSNNIYSSKNFVIEQDTTVNDESVLTNEENSYTDVLDLVFNSSTNLVVKIKHDENYSINNQIYHHKVNNQFYISPNSKIFEKPADDLASIQYLIDNNGINYAGIVPMLVAQIQRMCMDISALKDEINTLKNNG